MRNADLSAGTRGMRARKSSPAQRAAAGGDGSSWRLVSCAWSSCRSGSLRGVSSRRRRRRPTAAAIGPRIRNRMRCDGSEETPLPAVFSPNAPPEGCVAEMKAVAEQLAEDFPKQPDALQADATIHWATGDMVEAVRVWEKCLAVDSRFPPAYEGLGRVSQLQGDFAVRVEMFRKALALEPGNRQVSMMLADALVRANRTQEAVAQLNGVLRSGPAPPMALVMLGQAYLELGQYDDSRRALEAALQQLPNQRQAHFALTKVYDHLGQPDKAKLHRDRIEQLVEVYREEGKSRVRGWGTPAAVHKDAVRAHKDAAAVYHRHGNLVMAESLLRKAAALDPTDVECRQSLATLYDQTGRHSQARRNPGGTGQPCPERRGDPLNPDYARPGKIRGQGTSLISGTSLLLMSHFWTPNPSHSRA